MHLYEKRKNTKLYFDVQLKSSENGYYQLKTVKIEAIIFEINIVVKKRFHKGCKKFSYLFIHIGYKTKK